MGLELAAKSGSGVAPKVFTCFRCGHVWSQRKRKAADDFTPAACPNCKSVYWNRKRTRPVVESKEKADEAERKLELEAKL